MGSEFNKKNIIWESREFQEFNSERMNELRGWDMSFANCSDFQLDRSAVGRLRRRRLGEDLMNSAEGV